MSSSDNGSRGVARAILLIERIAGIILALVTVLIVFSSVGRYLFAQPIPDTFDLSRLILGVAIAWGLASLGFHGTHIKVDLLAHSLPVRLRNGVNFIAWAVLLAFTSLMTWKIWERFTDSLSGGDATMQLRIAHWPFFLAIWLGIVAALFTTSVRLWLILRDGRDLGEFDGIDEHLVRDIKEK